MGEARQIYTELGMTPALERISDDQPLRRGA